MKTCLLLAAALLAAPFWETTEPSDWSDEQLVEALTLSPWAQLQNGTHMYLATAQPLRLAEAELARRTEVGAAADSALSAVALGFQEDDEYLEFIADNAGDFIVLAVRVNDRRYLSREKSVKEMEQRCELRIDRQRYPLVGHFPPRDDDPYLRLVFPRAVKPDDKEVEFRLFVPGISLPYRRVFFSVARLFFRGELEI